MNQYHIYEKIGRGKHSVVYKGRKKKTIQYFAIKSVEKSQKSRVLQEVRTIHALDHKNILKFFAWYETSNHLWLILEYCVGGDLMSLVRQDVRLPESSVHDFARDLVVALQYLHSNSIIYCDLKPSNVLLDENGRLKLGGFGLSRRLSDINKNPLTNLPAAKRGTPCYMAPELFSEGATHSSASDLWALGCILYECATGRPPFLNTSLNQLVQEILNNEPAPIPGTSKEFSQLLGRLLDKNPATRIGWKELVSHPFWQVKLVYVDMPPEPALEAYVRKFGLAPAIGDANQGDRLAEVRARSMRASVDVTRLSRIALSNLEKEGEGVDYPAAQAQQNDIHIDSADAELDFEEVRDEGVDEEEPPSPSSADDGAVIDQGTAASGLGAGGHVVASVGADGIKSQARGRQAALDQSTRGGAGAAIAAAAAAVIATGAGGAAAAAAAKQAEAPAYPSPLDLEGDVAPPADASALEALIWHSSDSAVKPIVCNRRIERLPEPRWDPKALPFTPLSLEQMIASEQKELEAFLTHIYRAIASAAPLKDKVNVLSYFETLCADTGAANILINSSLTLLFIRLLKTARAPTLRIRLASVLGLLVRHATFISDELASTGILDVLGEAARDRNERVRRRVMATLGELLFYIATQQPDGAGEGAAAARGAWQVSSSTVGLVTRLLRPTEDDVVQHYAAKTIENICSQGGAWVGRFGGPEVAANLAALLAAPRSEGLKSTAASTLSRLLRAAPALLTTLLDRGALHTIVQGLGDSNSKVQIACVNILNLSMCQSGTLGGRLRAALAEERGLLGAALALLDHSLVLLRAKATTCILLLCRVLPSYLLEACRQKLVSVVERLQRDKDDNIQAAVAALRAELAAAVPTICSQVSAELGVDGRQAAASPARSALPQFQVLLHLVTSPFFRPAVVTPALTRDLAAYLRATTTGYASGGPDLQEFKATLMHVLEATCQHADVLTAQRDAVLESLLPALVSVVARSGESGDTRFFCLRLLSDALAHYLAETMAPDEPGLGGGGAHGAALLGALLEQNVLPLVPQLLEDEDPMPLYALKLLGGILEVDASYVSSLERMGLLPYFFEFLSLEHPNNNVHNIRLCRQLVAAESLPLKELQELQVADKVCAVLAYAHQNNVEPFLEPVLELCGALVARDVADLEAGGAGGGLVQACLQQLPVFLDLCANFDAAVATAASACVASLIMMYPVDTLTWVTSGDGAPLLLTALQGDPAAGEGEEDPPPPVPSAQANLLAALSGALAAVADSEGDVAMTHQLLSTVRLLCRSADHDVQDKAQALARMMAGMQLV